MELIFDFADKQSLLELMPRLFSILYENNRELLADTQEKEYLKWHSEVFPAMEKDERQIVTMQAGGLLIGFFQYYVKNGIFMMEEIQIRREYRKSGAFGDLYRWLLCRLPENITTVKAFADRANTRSHEILGHLGLECVGQSPDARFLSYSGSYAALLDKYVQNKDGVNEGK